MEARYTVAQAAEMLGIKSYVLRYWEDELCLRIGRNELGHRYYTGYDIQLFMNIKELKNRGLQLRAIKDLLPKFAHPAPGEAGSKVKLLEGEYPPEESGKASLKEKGHEKILIFQEILERLITQELHAKDQEEARCRSIDAAIRKQQLARKEAAAASEKKTKKKQRVHNG